MSDNEREWRQFILGELKEMKSDIKEIKQENRQALEVMTTMKVKIGAISSFFGGLVSLIIATIYNKIMK